MQLANPLQMDAQLADDLSHHFLQTAEEPGSRIRRGSMVDLESESICRGRQPRR